MLIEWPNELLHVKQCLYYKKIPQCMCKRILPWKQSQDKFKSEKWNETEHNPPLDLYPHQMLVRECLWLGVGWKFGRSLRTKQAQKLQQNTNVKLFDTTCWLLLEMAEKNSHSDNTSARFFLTLTSRVWMHYERLQFYFIFKVAILTHNCATSER